MRFFSGIFLLSITSQLACDVFPNPIGLPTPARFVDIADSNTDEPAFQIEHQGQLFDAIPGQIGHHGATVIAFEDDELLAAWYSYEGPDELDGASIFVARKPTDSTNWTEPLKVTGLPSPAANPVLMRDGDSLLLFFAHAPFQWWSSSLWLTESTDRGVSWSQPQRLNAPAGANVRNPPIKLADGSWLLPGYSDFWLNGNLLRSTDGRAWTLISAIGGPGEDILLQPSIVQLTDGTLLAAARNRGGGRALYSASADNGVTWTQSVRSDLPNPDSALLLTRLADGRLLIIFNDSESNRTPLVAMVSSDDGISWSGRTILAEGEGDFSYPSIVQTSDERLHVFFTADRERIVYQLLSE